MNGDVHWASDLVLALYNCIPPNRRVTSASNGDFGKLKHLDAGW